MRRTLLVLSLAAGVVGLAWAAQADVNVTMGPGGVPYWQQEHSDGHWRARHEWREAQQERRAEWLYNHCVRDWRGNTYCR